MWVLIQRDTFFSTWDKGIDMRFNKVFLACLVLGGSAMLAACGGGDSSPPPAAGSADLTLSGTAATGKAINGGALGVTCKSGSGTGTSGADGSFKVTVANGAGPCLLKITPVVGIPLYSMTSGSGTSANITPMTNMLVSYLLSAKDMNAASPEDWFKLATTRALLADPVALTARIKSDFILVLQKLAPKLKVTSDDFLAKSFVAGSLTDTTDTDLEELVKVGVVTSTGEASPGTKDTLKREGEKAKPVVVVVPTGATGAGS
jgi:hypothetical protein